MGKDFRVGLMTGVVLAGAALVWVATRPSLGPRPRVAGARHASPAPETGQTAKPPLPWETTEVVEANESQISSQESGRPQDILQQIQSIAPPSAPSNPASANSALAAGEGAQPATGSPLPDLTIYETTEPIKTTRFHIVRKGESLSSIAGQYYGTSSQWRKILTANQKALKDPNKIAPGTKLIIPE
jgi:nucleoid-associated protein YgaU